LQIAPKFGRELKFLGVNCGLGALLDLLDVSETIPRGLAIRFISYDHTFSESLIIGDRGGIMGQLHPIVIWCSGKKLIQMDTICNITNTVLQ